MSSPARRLEQAVRSLEAGRVAEAEAAARDVLRAAPTHPGALLIAGIGAEARGARDEAIALLERATSVAPDFVDAQGHLGTLYLRARRFGDAAARLGLVVARVPDHAGARSDLGMALLQADRHAEAEEAFRAAVRLEPAEARHHKHLGDAIWLGGREQEALAHHFEAVRLWRGAVDAHFFEHAWRAATANARRDVAALVAARWLELDPASPVAEHYLAASGGADVPARASDGYVSRTFDLFADSFDAQLAAVSYRGPELVAGALRAACPTARTRGLDGGCGTGMCGPLLRPLAAVLAGVDLSPRMVDRARARGCYDELTIAELTSFLEAVPASQQWVVCADTLNYFGDLRRVLRAAGVALAPGGHLVFSVEKARDERQPFALLEHGRYCHARQYIESQLADAGLSVLRVEVETLRVERGVPVPAFIVTAEKPG